MPDAKDKANDAVAALAEAAGAVDDAAQTAITAEAALEAAEERADAAEDAAEDLAEAVLRTELMREVTALSERVTQCHENHAGKITALETEIAALKVRLETMTTEPKVITVTERTEPSSTLPSSPETTETTTVITPADAPAQEENINLAPVPEKKKARWL